MPKVHWALINRIVGWEVRRNGVTRTYGSGENTGFCQEGVKYATADCIEPVRWYLTRIEDSHGNAVDLEYESFTRNSTYPICVRDHRRRAHCANHPVAQRTLRRRHPDDPVPRAGATNNKRASKSSGKDRRQLNPVDLEDPTHQHRLRFRQRLGARLIGTDTNKLLPPG